MSEQYCPSCRGAFNRLVRMELVQEGFSYNIYRCPVCTRTRKESGNMISSVTPEEMRSLNRKTAGGLLLTLGIGILGALLTGKKE